MGALLFVKILAQNVYNAHVGEDGKCQGGECFNMAYCGVIILQFMCMVATVVLSLRAHRVYSHLQISLIRPLIVQGRRALKCWHIVNALLPLSNSSMCCV